MKVSFIRPIGTIPQTPAAVQGVIATVISSTEIDLTWTSIAGAQNYTVRIFGNPVVTLPVTNAQFTQLAPATQYSFTVAAINTFGEGPQSTPVLATTKTALQPPGQVVGLTANPISTSEIDLAWSTTLGATNYIVQRNSANITTVAGLSYNDTGLTQATLYQYNIIATNSAGPGPASASVFASTNAAEGGTQVKLPNGGGNGFWPNNQFWSGNAHTVYSANILPLTRNNLQLNVVEVALSWADMEGPTRGDYSKAFATIDGILADLTAITTHKVGLIVKGWLTYFGTPTNIPSRTSLACWPQYVVNNGWPTSFIQAGQGRSQLSWNIDDVWTALTAMFTAIGQRYNAHPNFLALGFQDETEAISQLDNVAQPAPWSPSQVVINSVHYNSKLQQLFFDMSDSMPNTLTYAPFNFLPPGDATEVPTMSAMINAMLSSRPGKWLMGGPDPWTHKTTFHRVATGLSGTTGDIRRQCVMFNNVEQGVETAGSTTAAAIYTRAISLAAPVDGSTPNTPGGCQILCWPYLPDGQSGQVITVTPIVNAIAANNGQVAPLPTVGSYSTT